MGLLGGWADRVAGVAILSRAQAIVVMLLVAGDRGGCGCIIGGSGVVGVQFLACVAVGGSSNVSTKVSVATIVAGFGWAAWFGARHGLCKAREGKGGLFKVLFIITIIFVMSIAFATCTALCSGCKRALVCLVFLSVEDVLEAQLAVLWRGRGGGGRRRGGC